MLSYPATLDVPESIAHTICLWLAAHRRAHDARPWQRAATCRAQAVLLLRWMVAGTALTTLARDSKVSRATAYRYLHEALGVIADRAPDLPEVLQRLRRSKEPFVCLDGTLIRTDRVAQRNPDTGRHLWYSGKAGAFGGNVQVVMDHTGFPVYTGPVEPGSTHDLTAARLHVLPALYRSAWLGMPVLADKGYQGAGIGVLTPTKNPCPTPDEETRNNLLSAMRAPAERANAMFKHFRALQRVSLDPAAITTIMAAALVIITLWHDS